MNGAAPGRRELAWAALLAALLFGAVYGDHVLDGGWYADDWHNVSALEHARAQGSTPLAAALELTYRPVHSVQMLVLWELAGRGQAAYLAAGLLVNAVACTLLYAVLRTARLDRVVAGAVVALYAVAPHIDATRLWTAAFAPAMALALLCLGLLGAVRAARAAPAPVVRRRLWQLSVPAGVALACLSYELMAPLAVLAVPLLRRAGAPWPVALRLGALATATAGAVLAVQTASFGGRRATTGLADLPGRLADIGEAELDVVRATYPGGELLLGLPGALLGALVLALALLARRRPAPDRPPLGPWLGLAATGLAVIVLGLVLLAPADAYYVPRPSGIGTRLGAFAAVGEAMALVAVAGLVCALATHAAGRPRLASPCTAAVAAAAVVALAVAELGSQDAWSSSWRQSQQVVAAVRATLGPELPARSSVVTYGHVRVLLPADVPVFATEWDLDGALELAYDDPTVQAHPASPGVGCDPDALRSRDGRTPDDTVYLGPVPYGSMWFVDVRARRAQRVRTQAECAAALERALAVSP